MRDKLITLSYIFSGNVKKIKQAIDCNMDVKVCTNFLKELKKRNIKVITILDKEYPKSLLELYDPPFVLYCLGNIGLLNNKISAIIGARRNLSYSKNVCKKLVERLEDNFSIVSGLAVGIDSFAHKYAIENNMSTIAVIGSGFDHIYPKDNLVLAGEISQNHLLISEYPFAVKPLPTHFPLRNRIIAALAKDIYVIEAGVRSGSLITANIGIELGRNIYCAPGSLFNKGYEGSHQLINDGAYLLELRNEV
ncbi:MAG: DNA-processing protein DprA [Bacilli bacterium]